MTHYSKAKDLPLAMADAAAGGQALFTHMWSAGSEAPACFQGTRLIGKLFDQDVDRLKQTALQLGIKRICVHRKGGPGQHVDLVGSPLKKAIQEAQAYE